MATQGHLTACGMTVTSSHVLLNIMSVYRYGSALVTSILLATKTDNKRTDEATEKKKSVVEKGPQSLR